MTPQDVNKEMRAILALAKDGNTQEAQRRFIEFLRYENEHVAGAIKYDDKSKEVKGWNDAKYDSYKRIEHLLSLDSVL